MSKVVCEGCGNEVSKEVEQCPHCGEYFEDTYKFSFMDFLGVVFVLIVLARLLDYWGVVELPSFSSASQTKTQKIYKEGEAIKVGYISYGVWKSWWSSRLTSNPFLDEAPNAKYLFVDISIRNDDKEARTIPMFTLIDEKGAEYESSDNFLMVEGAITPFDSLNPSVEKRGKLIFDVPQKSTYLLKVSGGYWSDKNAFIKLEPK